MARHADREPDWVAAILRSPLIYLAARLGLTSAFILGGLTKLFDFPAAASEQAHFGLHPGWLWAAAAIVVELTGSILLVSGRFIWLGAGALGVLTAVATVAANAFWTMHGRQQFLALNTFFEHVGLIAGFVMIALLAERIARSVPEPGHLAEGAHAHH